MAPHWVGNGMGCSGRAGRQAAGRRACIFHFCGSGGKQQPERLERFSYPSGGGGGGRGHFSSNTKKESMGLPLLSV